RNGAAAHRRRMAAGLQEQRIGDDGADGCEREQARDHVLWIAQQQAHEKSARGLRLDCSRFCTAAAAARHLIVACNLSRHFSSPEGFALVMGSAAPASASRCCLTTLAPPAR